jgi:hypothetical protein
MIHNDSTKFIDSWLFAMDPSRCWKKSTDAHIDIAIVVDIDMYAHIDVT